MCNYCNMNPKGWRDTMKTLIINPEFSTFDSVYLTSIIYICIGIYGEECQKTAKTLLSLFRNWYTTESPDPEEFNELCSEIIEYEGDMEDECPLSFHRNPDVVKPKYVPVAILLKKLIECYRADSETLKHVDW